MHSIVESVELLDCRLLLATYFDVRWHRLRIQSHRLHITAAHRLRAAAQSLRTAALRLRTAAYLVVLPHSLYVLTHSRKNHLTVWEARFTLSIFFILAAGSSSS